MSTYQGTLSYGYGYTDVHVERNLAIIKYTVDPFASQKTIQSYLLYRCAAVTIEHGYDFFVIADVSTCPIYPKKFTQEFYTQYIVYPPIYYSLKRPMINIDCFYKWLAKTRCDNGPLYPKVWTAYIAIFMYSAPVPKGIPTFVAEDIMAHLEVGII
ncbi:MAG TPA: hypothetical protein VHA52_00450 [Candidatus Babeliaceae bacterium]|nr:hypothetical protein [Candidatus Babeliaceae bacterium]